MIGVVRKGVDVGGCEGMMCTVVIVLSIMRAYIHTFNCGSFVILVNL